jgi:hypothetical protein
VVELLWWLAEAGFAAVDLHRMSAGHALLGGWNPRAPVVLPSTPAAPRTKKPPIGVRQ